MRLPENARDRVAHMHDCFIYVPASLQTLCSISMRANAEIQTQPDMNQSGPILAARAARNFGQPGGYNALLLRMLAVKDSGQNGHTMQTKFFKCGLVATLFGSLAGTVSLFRLV